VHVKKIYILSLCKYDGFIFEPAVRDKNAGMCALSKCGGACDEQSAIAMKKQKSIVI
jgi:hypothetical protein